MLTPERRAFMWYTSLLPACRHILVSQNLSSDHVSLANDLVFDLTLKLTVIHIRKKCHFPQKWLQRF